MEHNFYFPCLLQRSRVDCRRRPPTSYSLRLGRLARLLDPRPTIPRLLVLRSTGHSHGERRCADILQKIEDGVHWERTVISKPTRCILNSISHTVILQHT